MHPDPINHLTAYRNQKRAVGSVIFTLVKEVAKLARLREDNHECIGQMNAQHGAVRAQRIAEEFGSDDALSRELFESLSGTEAGRLLLIGVKHISLYPHRLPPEAA